MNDPGSLSGRPRTRLVADGETFDVWPLSFDEIGELQAWVDAQHRDLLELASEQVGTGRFTMAQEQFLLRTALELAARPRALIGTPAADELLRSVEGTKRLLFVGIRKGRPDFTEEAAAALFGKLNPFELFAAFQATGLEAVMTDPKAPSGGGGATSPATTDAPPSTGGGSATS
jgi:hypothetical protein